ncbi:DUF1592 domain-containing protein [bacterium]|nr:DUF1592 domain-containing protein [bacterium]
MKDKGFNTRLLRISFWFSLILLVVGFATGQWLADSGDWILFLGRFHPVILHQPIGIFTVYLLALLVSSLTGEDKGSSLVCDIILSLSAVTASMAAAAGFLLASEGGFGVELLSDHKLEGTIFTTAVMLAVFFRSLAITRQRIVFKLLKLLCLVVATYYLIKAGHKGGSLTHGSTYLTKYAPDWLPGAGGVKAEPEANDATAAVLDEGSEAFSVMEIFEANCFKCHGPEKQKGDYRMDDREIMFAGGQSELPAIVPGSPMESYLVELITLPKDDDDLMPPEGKAELSDEEIGKIIRWISEGAILDEPTAGAEPAEPVIEEPTVEGTAPEIVPAVLKKEIPEAVKAKLASGELGSDLDYFEQVKPLFDMYCLRCHGPDKQKAQIRVDNLDPDMVFGPHGDEWKHILDVINSGEMPEADEIQPSVEERNMMVNWLTDELFEAKELKKGKVAPVIRRLNKDQYTNTLKELLGVDVEFGKHLPPEALSEEGFQNNGEVLGMSSLLVEYYIQIAREALSKVIATEAAPEIHHFKVNFGRNIRDKDGKFGLGYKSASFNYKDYLTEALSVDDKPFNAKAFKFGVSAPYNTKNKKQSIDDVFYVDMRGSSKDRYSISKEGVSLTTALPHVEKAASKWHGPSPNLKIVMRDFPTEGDFAMRVEASRPESMAVESDFIHYSKQRPQIQYKFGQELVAKKDAIVLDATKPFEEYRIAIEQGFVRHHHESGPSPRAVYRFKTNTRNGVYQLDVVYASAESRPVDITINNSELESVLVDTTGGWDLSDMRTHSVGLVQLGKGNQSIQFKRDNGPIPHISYLVLTPVESTPQIETAFQNGGALESELEKLPYLRAFMGSRTDDGMEYRTFDEAIPFTAPIGKREIIEFRGRLENLPLPVVDQNDKTSLANMAVMGLWSDAFAANSREQANPIIIHSIEFEGPYLNSWPPETHKKIFIDSPNKNNPSIYSREIFSYFMSKAYRRRATDQEVDRIWNFWNDSYPASESFEHSIQEALIVVLCSPNFLYLVEPDQEAGSVSDFELASRLSYFLWNTMPDDELFYLAANGKLTEQMEAQVERMLKDERAWSFIESFTTQWLDIASLDRVEMNIDLYPKYNRFVKNDMIQETLHFFREVLVNDLPALNFIDSDFTMLNQNLAQFYGINGVSGSEFRRVKVDRKKQRGGLISQGSFLAGHSTGDDSHPVKRGVWLIEKILDDPPPPAPPNVPQIDMEDPDLIKLTMREQLERHRDSESCRDCHMKIDPWGVAFEGYDATGLLRDRARKQDADGRFFQVDLSTESELENGRQLKGIADLKNYLASDRQEDLIRSIAKHLLSYSLGRSLTFADEEAVSKIVVQSKADGGKMQALLNSVVSSPLFLNR